MAAAKRPSLSLPLFMGGGGNDFVVMVEEHGRGMVFRRTKHRRIKEGRFLRGTVPSLSSFYF